ITQFVQVGRLDDRHARDDVRICELRRRDVDCAIRCAEGRPQVADVKTLYRRAPRRERRVRPPAWRQMVDGAERVDGGPEFRDVDRLDDHALNGDVRVLARTVDVPTRTSGPAIDSWGA